MGFLLGLSVVLATVAIWWSEIRPMFRWTEGLPQRVWRDVTMHGRPWWRVHVWPHVVGGVALMALLHVPGVAAPSAWWGKLGVVALIQAAWELAQIVTWSPNPRMARWAVLWAPLRYRWQWPQAPIHAALGALWTLWHPIMLAAGWAGLLINAVVLYAIYVRVTHENWRGPGAYPWGALGWGVGWMLLGAGLAGVRYLL